jgi:hypothetical protein
MKNYILKLILVAGVVVVVAGYGVANYMRPSGSQHQNSGGGSATASYAYDYNNPRVLLGYAQNVFAVKVIKEIGNAPQVFSADIQFPHIQYEADVLYNIKGNASGKVVVDFDATDHGSLTPGVTYLLTTRHLEEFGPWYYAGTHSASRTVISPDGSLTNEQLIEFVKKHDRTYQLLNAYPNEVLRDIDIQKNRTVNSFQSLSEAEKQMVYAKFQELIPARSVPAILPPLPPPTPELAENDWDLCHDGGDNDDDSLIDFADPNCKGFYQEDVGSLCRDRKDNDRDGKADAADPDCATFYPPEVSPLPPPPPAPFIPTSTTSTTSSTPAN